LSPRRSHARGGERRPDISVGQKAVYERTFTRRDVEAFAEISGDKGIHHVRPDKDGRVMVQGLLTATLPTKLGGDLNYIARTMKFEFVRPVFVGDTVRCEAVPTRVEPKEGRLSVDMDIRCTNQLAEVVLFGKTIGIIRA
jgi:3-hydroxybutyryl-CoA dehydratase